jgi:hypothetical protein
MIERLVGMQAQVPANPYLALWSRLKGFRPEELSDLIAGRQAVRAGLMRATIHLVSAQDCLAFQPLTLPVLMRTFKSAFAKTLAGADVEEIVAAGRELLLAEPRTRAELSAELAPRWPDVPAETLGAAVGLHLPLLQVPPRGLWGESGQARWALTEQWLGRQLEPRPSTEGVLLRYLAAFGPASVADMRTWSRFTGLRPVVEALRPRLRTFRDERGRELFDVPGAPLPDPDTPAPPRFLPEYDNLLLSHDDRSRMLAGHGPRLPFPQGGKVLGTLLVDGFFRAFWKIVEEEETATLLVDRLEQLPGDPPGAMGQVEEEGLRLLSFICPASAELRVELEAAL